MAFCHREAYARAIEAVYRYPVRTHRGEALFRIGGTWTSTPFSEYGFPAAEVDDAFMAELPRPFLIKVESEEETFAAGGLEGIRLGRLARLDLEPEVPEEDFFRSREHQVRKAVNKAGRAGWTADVRPLAEASIEEYHERHVRHMRDRHGSPPLARAHFEALCEHLGERVVVSRAVRPRGDGQAGGAGEAGDPVHIGAWLLGVLDPESSSVQITEILTVPEALPDRVADLAHWGLVCDARRRGLAAFDFGICRYEGQERYKKKWGSRFRTSFALASDPRFRPADPERGVYPLLRAVWRRLPLPLHRRLGPLLRRRIGM